MATHTTDTAVHRALATIRRTYAEMDRISRAMVEYEPRQSR